MSRPHLSKKAHELQAMYDACRGNHAQLLEILNELHHRTTPKAVALRGQIEKELLTKLSVAPIPPKPVIAMPPPLPVLPTQPQTASESLLSDSQALARMVPTLPQPETKSPPTKPIAPPPFFPTPWPAAPLATPVNPVEPAPPKAQHRIQPKGVRGRPEAWTPKMLDDVQLPVKADDSLAKIFCAALSELIRELKRKKRGTQQFLLEDGKQLSVDLRGYSYQFEFAEEANLFESAKVDVVIGGKTIFGQITGLLQGYLIVTLQDDFGPVIHSCVLRIDNTALLQALHDRLAQIESGEASSFRLDFATTVVQNKGVPRPLAPVPTWPWSPKPNDKQQEFVRMALANEVIWLWGPPGTGKTDVLAVFTRLQYEAEKRVLICSNTNQAVDQLLLQLCRKMQDAKDTALDEGRVLRLGRIEHDELRKSFEDLITIDGIVARKSKELTERKKFIEAELVCISEQATVARTILGQFGAHDACEKLLAAAESELQSKNTITQRATKAVREALSKKQGCQSELKEFHSAGVIRRFFMRGENAITKGVSEGKTPPRLVMLQQQYRMDEKICRLISVPFYKGQLVTAPDRKAAKESRLPFPFGNGLTLIDTSSVWPFTTRNAFKSHLNLMHALVIRNLLFHLEKHGCFQDARGRDAIGLCSPYAAQAKLLGAISKGQDWKNLRIGTAHRFQGDERETILVDLVDSVPEFNAGLFLQANNFDASGAKLFNVAFSRAKENLIVVGNLDFLDKKLPGDAILRGLLHDLQSNGETVDARDVLAMYPIQDDLERFGTRPQLDPETARTGLFRETDFWKTCRLDLASAKKSIVIFSGFITLARTGEIGDILRSRIMAGVKVRCVTRSPAFNGSIPTEHGRSALQALETIGVAVDLRQDIHEKVVVIDGRIVWFGSLNPLSHSNKTSEIMARVDNAAFASQIAQLLSLRPNSVPDDHGESFAEPENPRCPVCGGWTVVRSGRYGPFRACEADRHWSENLDRPRGTRKKTTT